MKFLLAIIVIYIFNAHISFVSSNTKITDDFFIKMTQFKYILPKEEEIDKVDTRLLIRISTPGDNLNGVYSYKPGFYFRFDADDNDSFIITKFGKNVQSYNIKHLVFKFSTSWEKLSEELSPSYELLVICKKNENQSFFTDRNKKVVDENYLIMSFPVEVVDTKDNFNNKDNKLLDDIIENFLDSFNNLSSRKNIFGIKKMLTSTSNNLYYFKESKENGNSNLTKNFFIFKKSLKISKKLKSLIDNFRQSSVIPSTNKNNMYPKFFSSLDQMKKLLNKYSNNKSQNPVIMTKNDMNKTELAISLNNVENTKLNELETKKLNYFKNTRTMANTQDFIYFKNQKEFKDNLIFDKSIDLHIPNSTSIIHIQEIDPHSLMRNYVIKPKRSLNLKLDLESLNLFLKLQHEKKIFYDKIVVNEHLNYLKNQYKSIKIDQDIVKDEFKYIYDKFIKDKNNETIIKKNDTVFNNKSETLNSKINNSSYINNLHTNNLNVTQNSKNIKYDLNHTIHNTKNNKNNKHTKHHHIQNHHSNYHNNSKINSNYTLNSTDKKFHSKYHSKHHSKHNSNHIDLKNNKHNIYNNTNNKYHLHANNHTNFDLDEIHGLHTHKKHNKHSTQIHNKHINGDSKNISTEKIKHHIKSKYNNHYFNNLNYSSHLNKNSKGIIKFTENKNIFINKNITNYINSYHSNVTQKNDHFHQNSEKSSTVYSPFKGNNIPSQKHQNTYDNIPASTDALQLHTDEVDLKKLFLKEASCYNQSNIKNLTKLNLKQEKVPEKIGYHQAPFLKNERIKFVNGSLVVIQTLMLGNKDEKIGDMKRKFENIIKNNY